MSFVRSTVVGGLLFLVPIVVLVGILGKAHEFFQKLTVPIAEAVPVKGIAGIPTPRIIAALAIVLFCFLAGLFARTKLAKRMVAWLESALLSNIPGYSFFKGMGESIVAAEGKPHEVVLARIEDAWQFALVVERMHEGHVAVFVPGAPNPWSGSVYLMTEDRIKPLDASANAVMKSIKAFGQGSGKLTQGRL